MGASAGESPMISTLKSIDGLSNVQVPKMQAPIQRMSGGNVTPNKLSPREFYSMEASDKIAPAEFIGGDKTTQSKVSPRESFAMSATPSQGMSPCIQPLHSPFFTTLRAPSIPMRVGRSPMLRPGRSPNISNHPSRSPMMRFGTSPRLSSSSQVRPAPPPQPEIIVLEGEQTENLKMLPGGKVEWTIPEAWATLQDMPRDQFLTSPAFGVRRAKHMVLNFYPNGSKTTAEDGQCTVELSRGPDCAGVKFELNLNGRKSGPKACISRRFHRDWKRPTTGFFDETNGGEVVQHVVVGIMLLEVFGAEGS